MEELSTNEIGNGSFHSNLNLTKAPGVLTNIIVALNEEVPHPKWRKYSSDLAGEIEIK